METSATSTAARLQQEYQSALGRRQTEMLKIRLTPGMEMLAQELSTGTSIYEPEWRETPPADSSPKMWYPYENETATASTLAAQPFPDLQLSPAGPWPLPFATSPFDTSPFVDGQYMTSPRLKPTVRRRSQHWSMDATGAYPVLFIEREKVAFYQTMSEMEAFLGGEKQNKILLNIANVVSVEKILSYEVLAQNLLYTDVANGVMGDVPPIKLAKLELNLPTTFPILNRPEDQMMFKIEAVGGQAPYHYSIYGQPSDLFVTTDGWLSGYIDADLWPTSGYVEFLIRIVVEDSSIPKETVVLNYRYRLYPPT